MIIVILQNYYKYSTIDHEYFYQMAPGKTMIIDAFTYNGEDDLLLLRLRLLHHIVDRFVIVEADKTFTGLPKRQKFRYENFEPFREKIRYFFIDTLDQNPSSPWSNETLQRNSLALGFHDLKGADIIILSDVDEIPNPDAILKFDTNRFIYASLNQTLHYFRLSYQSFTNEGQPLIWQKAKIITFENFKKHFAKLDLLRSEKVMGLTRSFKRFYLKRHRQNIDSGGWHFSYLMTPDQIYEKIQSFSHTELNTSEFNDKNRFQEAIKYLQNPFNPNSFLRKIDISNQFPIEIGSMEFFKKWI